MSMSAGNTGNTGNAGKSCNFSPGPWRRAWNKSRGGSGKIRGKSVSRIVDDNGEAVAFAAKRPRQVANSQLIAAAPEMYEMLQFFCSRKHTPICRNAPDSCSVCKLNEILKKARGEE